MALCRIGLVAEQRGMPRARRPDQLVEGDLGFRLRQVRAVDAPHLRGSPLPRRGPPGRWRAELAKLEIVDAALRKDRKSDVEGKSVAVRVDLGGSRSIKKKKT